MDILYVTAINTMNYRTSRVLVVQKTNIELWNICRPM